MDGTLVDSEPIHKLIERQLFEELGIEVTEEEHASYTGTTSEFFWGSIKERHCVEKPLDELVVRNRQKYLHYVRMTKGLAPTPGVIDLLGDFQQRGISLGLATSASRGVMENILRAFELEKYFAVRKCSEDVLHGKPDPEIFLKVAEGLNVDPHGCVVFEDSTNGIAGAKAAGMKCIGYSQQGKNPQDMSGADQIVDCYTRLSVEDVRCLWV